MRNVMRLGLVVVGVWLAPGLAVAGVDDVGRESAQTGIQPQTTTTDSTGASNRATLWSATSETRSDFRRRRIFQVAAGLGTLLVGTSMTFGVVAFDIHPALHLAIHGTWIFGTAAAVHFAGASVAGQRVSWRSTLEGTALGWAGGFVAALGSLAYGVLGVVATWSAAPILIALYVVAPTVYAMGPMFGAIWGYEKALEAAAMPPAAGDVELDRAGWAFLPGQSFLMRSKAGWTAVTTLIELRF